MNIFTKICLNDGVINNILFFIVFYSLVCNNSNNNEQWREHNKIKKCTSHVTRNGHLKKARQFSKNSNLL